MIRNKHLSIFDNERDFNSELASGNLKKPHVSLIKGASKVCYEALPKPIDLSLYNIYGEPIPRTTANCYVVSNPGVYCFPLVYGNALKNGATNSAAYTKVGNRYEADFLNHINNQIIDPYIYNNTGCTPVSAELTICDYKNIISDIKCSGTEIVFTVNVVPDTGANAIISVIDDMGLIMWSWHIWVWGDSLATETITNSDGENFEILPINLATKKDPNYRDSRMMNWFYQWGRPMPLLLPESYNSNNIHEYWGNGTFEFVNEIGLITHGEALRKPEKFMVNPQGTAAPDTTFGYINLWNTTAFMYLSSEPIKSIYDPCPQGFCVPDEKVFTGFAITKNSHNSVSELNVVGNFNSGWNFKKNDSDNVGIFFPASGYQTWGYIGQYLAYVGEKGFYWNKNYGYFTIDNTGLDNHSKKDFILENRAEALEGYSIRPVKEKEE